MKREHYVVFGAGEKPNKGIIMVRVPGMRGFAAIICELKNSGYDYGEQKFPLSDIEGVYTTLYFTRKESLEAVTKVFQDTFDKWED